MNDSRAEVAVDQGISAGRLERERVRAQVTRLADRLDSAFRVPGTRIRFGLDAIIGLVPGIGDLAGLLLGLWLIGQAQRVRAPLKLKLRMAGNLLADAVFGLVPLVGDLIDVAFKANQRNRRLLLDWMDAQDRPAAVRRPLWPWLLAAGLVLVAAGIWQLWL